MNPVRFQDPKHVAIIMDGNGRWAAMRELPRMEGHRQGVVSLDRLLKFLPETNVEYLTVYAFSSENWARPKEETDFLMHLLESYLREKLTTLIQHNIRLCMIGQLSGLPESVQEALIHGLHETRECSGQHLILALNYGSRLEMIEAAKKLAQNYKNGNIDLEDLKWSDFRKYLFTKNLPDPDLLIRTSGEERLSNFLLLQCAYAEFYTTPVLWPDFEPKDFLEALEIYQERNRRYGRSQVLAYNPLI